MPAICICLLIVTLFNSKHKEPCLLTLIPMMTSPQNGTGQEQLKLLENVLNNKQFHVLTFLVSEIG